MTFTEMYLVVKAGAHNNVNSSKGHGWFQFVHIIFCVLFYDAVSSWPIQRRRMIMNYKTFGKCHGLIEISYLLLPGGAQENHENHRSS
jgi:hypothetical protein